MSPQTDVSDRLTVEQACAKLGISRRTLDREIAAGHIHPKREGKRSVFDNAELDAWLAARKPAPAPFVLPPAPTVAEMANLPAPPAGIPMGAGIQPDLIIARLVEMVVESRKPPTTYVPLKEAADETGLSHKFLRRQVKNGNLPAIRDVSIKVHREDLADLDLSSELIKPPKKRGRK
jgi:excisionase family DNA binding protein